MAKPTILIADDDKDIRSGTKKLLEKDYNILEAADGEDALKIVDSNKDISVVLLDIVMPKLDGFEVLQSIRKYHRKIKVIMFSSLEEIKKAILAMQMGAFNYISKPYDVNVLKEILKSATKNSGSQD